MRLFRRPRAAPEHSGPHVLLEIAMHGVNVVELDCEALLWVAKFGGCGDLLELPEIGLKVTATPYEHIRAGPECE